MTRAKSELFGALLVAVVLVAFLAWYQGRRDDVQEAAPPVTGTVVRTEATEQLPLDADAVAPGAEVAAGEPAPQLPNAVVARDREFINEVFPTLSSWSVAEVRPLLSNAALAGSTDQELSQVMSTLEERLGELRYFDSPQPVAASPELEAQTPGASLQPYTFTAYYEEGEAEVNLVLEKRPQDSSLYSFDITVPN